MEQRLAELKTALAEISDLHSALALLGWDQETCMPPGGAATRAEQISTLSKIAHEKFTTDEMGLLLDGLMAQLPALNPDSDEAAMVRVAHRDYQKAKKLPAGLVAEFTRVASLAVEAWREARATNNFAMFRPHLEKIVALTVQKAEAWGYEDHIYDALLDEYEPEMKSSQVATVFKQVRNAIVPLVDAIVSRGKPVDDAFLHEYYDPQKQWDFGVKVITDFGFDFKHGRQDKSTHPFTTSFTAQDVRLTTRIMENYLPSALTGTMHEAGHGMYEQGFPPSLMRTQVDDATSLGFHESQSRMWENIIGRSRAFWSHYYPQLRQVFPEQLGGIQLNDFYRAVNKVSPSLIRVEADEVTYSLHIFVRFEIERDLVTGAVKVADLPEVWREKMKSYLGIVPDSDTTGVLQDIHWSSGLIGYFPTYALGNIISAQLYNKMLQDEPDIPTRIAGGDFERVLGWHRANVHQYGRKYTPSRLLQKATGSALDAQPYIDYVTAKYSDIYELS